MSDKTLRYVTPLILVALLAALVIQGFAGRSRRQDINQTAAQAAAANHKFEKHICDLHDSGLNVLHDVIVLALTPAPGKSLTSAQVKSITAFETAAFGRIDQARC